MFSTFDAYKKVVQLFFFIISDTNQPDKTSHLINMELFTLKTIYIALCLQRTKHSLYVRQEYLKEWVSMEMTWYN